MNGATPVNILLADDDPGDCNLTQRAFASAKLSNRLYVVNDGQEALDFLLHRGRYEDPEDAPRPDLVLLDLNMPKVDGREVLERMRSESTLRRIPVVVLTTSKQEEDILRSYDLGVNSYINKPVSITAFMETVHALENYWFQIVVLPSA
jgi:CheY-like chemotaxis protein